MFHEFGHGLHHMLTRVGYPSIAGINGVSWDAVELPSQFMENFAWRPEVLRRHGAPLRNRRAAARRQAGAVAGLAHLPGRASPPCASSNSRCSISGCTPNTTPRRARASTQILAEVRAEVAVFAVPDWNRFPHNFAHIFSGGYAAGYYSYKWAEVLAADAFAAFEERGVFDRAVAQRFLDSILSQGGSRKALDAFVDFRGRPPDVNALLRQQGLGG